MTEAQPLAIGIGCRAGCPASAAVAAVEAAWQRAGRAWPARLFTLDRKADEPGLRQAATHLGLGLTGLPPEALQATADRVATRSAAAEARFGVPAVAEAAALAGAGPDAVLVVPRLVVEGVTCAVAARPEDLS